MTMRRAVRIALLALVACGDDPGVRVLSENEALRLFKAMSPVVRGDGEIISRHADSILVGCPDGGEIKLVFGSEITVDGDSIVVYISSVGAPRRCVLDELVVEGSPSVAYWQRHRLRGSSFHNYGTALGEVKWSLREPDGTAHDGSCSIEMTVDVVSQGEGETTGTFVGRLCDHQVELDVREHASIWMLRQ